VKFRTPGLRGKFVIALGVAAVLPFLAGLVALETFGYHHLLAERGKLHQVEALTLARALDQSSKAQGLQFHAWMAADPGLLMFGAGKNREVANQTPAEIAAETRRLDEAWTSLPAGDPQLAAVLDNPGSACLARYRALHPEVAEVLATDLRGRLIAATGKTSDVEQSDEDWWQKGAKLPPGGVWADVLQFDASAGVFSRDIIVPLYERDVLAGVAKLSVDVTSVFAGLGFDGEELGERWQIALPDGRILASSQRGFVPLSAKLADDTLRQIRRTGQGWTTTADSDGNAKMAGYVAMDPGDRGPHAYVIFSSPRNEVVAPLQRNFLWLGLVGATLLGSCLLAGFYLIDRNILQPLAVLGEAARSISASASLHQPGSRDEGKINGQRAQAEKTLEKIQAIHTGDEVETLAGDLAVMTTRVLRYQLEMEAEVAAKTAVIREDLELAAQFQTALLPSRYPEIPPPTTCNPLRLQFAHFYQPADTLGGDFFDLLVLDENCAGILIADVMGHGTRSALITAILRALVRTYSTMAPDPGAFLTLLNLHLHEAISRSGQTLFVTAFFLVLDTHNGLASWAVAGHPAPLRVRRGSGEAPEPLWITPPHQPALGLIPQAVFRTSRSPLTIGDVFLLFTDGAIEAESPTSEAFGVERLATSFIEALDGPMAAIPAKIIGDVTAYQGTSHYEDDVCLVAVEAVASDSSTAPASI